jgi:TolB protein
MNKDGSDIKQITTKDENITEAIFSPDGKKIYFLQSGYYGSYSPIAQAHPHKFDIFSINIDGSDEKKITNYNAYDIRSLSITSDGKSIIFKKIEYENKYSIFKLIFDESDNLISVLPEGEHFEPQIGPDDKLLAFVDKRKDYKKGYEYELFIVDLKDMQIKQLTDLRKNIENPRFLHNEKKLLFTFNTNWPNNPPQYELMQIDLDGSNLKKIELKILN